MLAEMAVKTAAAVSDAPRRAPGDESAEGVSLTYDAFGSLTLTQRINPITRTDSNTNASHANTSVVSVGVSFFSYASHTGADGSSPSGAYVFRPNGTHHTAQRNATQRTAVPCVSCVFFRSRYGDACVAHAGIFGHSADVISAGRDATTFWTVGGVVDKTVARGVARRGARQSLTHVGASLTHVGASLTRVGASLTRVAGGMGGWTAAGDARAKHGRDGGGAAVRAQSVLHRTALYRALGT